MNKREPKATVCVVTYNRSKDLLECLDSIYASRYNNFDVLVFDNHSDKKITQGSLSKYPNLKYFYNEENIGGAGGRSFCEKKATGKYIMFLDDDTIVDEDMIGELVKVMDNDVQLGMCAPKNFFYDGEKTNVLLSGLGQFSMLTTLCSDAAYHQEDKGQFESIIPIDYAQNGFMVRKEVSYAVGGHDVKLFMTYMETDFFRRVQEYGFKTLYIPTAKLWHKFKLHPEKNNLRDNLGLDSPARIYYNMRNRSVIMKRYAKLHAKIFYILVLVHLFFLFYFYKFISYEAQKDYFLNLWKGYSEGILIFMGIRDL